MEQLFKEARAILEENNPPITGVDAILVVGVYMALIHSQSLAEAEILSDEITDQDTLLEFLVYKGPAPPIPEKDIQAKLRDLIDREQTADILNGGALFDDLFGDILSNVLAEDVKRRGVFFSSPEIADFVRDQVRVKQASQYFGKEGIFTVLDPACGTGRLILKLMNEPKMAIYGFDTNPACVLLCKINVFLWASELHEFKQLKRIGLRNYMAETPDPSELDVDVLVLNPPAKSHPINGRQTLDPALPRWIEWTTMFNKETWRVVALPRIFFTSEAQVIRPVRETLERKFKTLETKSLDPKNGSNPHCHLVVFRAQNDIELMFGTTSRVVMSRRRVKR